MKLVKGKSIPLVDYFISFFPTDILNRVDNLPEPPINDMASKLTQTGVSYTKSIRIKICWNSMLMATPPLIDDRLIRHI